MVLEYVSVYKQSVAVLDHLNVSNQSVKSYLDVYFQRL